jgi:Zn-dependent metalloprotease
LRDLSDPDFTGDPGHMSQLDPGTADYGQVHKNSNIHNKAAYHFLTAKAPDGKQIFLPEEVAQIYYQALLRLNPMAQFADMVAMIVEVAETFYPDQSERTMKTDAIRKAYADVGIAA